MLEGYLFDEAWSMSMSMPSSGSADAGPNPIVDDDFPFLNDDDAVGNNDGDDGDTAAPTMAPTPSPTLPPPTTTTDDVVVVVDDADDGAVTTPTTAPTGTDDVTDPNESSSIPGQATGDKDGGGRRKAVGLAWIGIGAVVAALVGGVWLAKNRHRGVAGKVTGGAGESSGSSSIESSSDSRLQEV